MTAGVAGTRRRFQAFFFVQFAAFSGFAVFRNVYLKEMGFSGLEMGLIGFLMTITGVLAGPAWGVLTDWSGREKGALVVGASVSALGILAYPVAERLADPLLVVAVGTGVYAAFRAPVVPIANALVLSRGYDYGRVRAFGSIAFGIGSLGFGYLVAGLGTAVVAYAYVLGMAVLVVIVRDLPIETDATGTDFENPGALATSVPYLLLLGVAFLMGMTMRGGSAFFSVYMRAVEVGDAMTGTAWALKTAFEAAVFLAAIRIEAPHRVLLLVGAAGTALPNFVLAATADPALILAAQAVSGVGYAAFALGSVNLAHALAPDGLASTAQTVLAAAGLGVGGAIGQAVAGHLVDLVGVQAMYWYVGAIGLAAAATSLLVRR